MRNRTPSTLARIEVTGTARSGGALVGSGSSQGFWPAVLEPGEWAFGYVYFSTELPPDAVFDLSAKGTEPGSRDLFREVNLRITEVAPATGSFGSLSLVGIVANETDQPVRSPQAAVLCMTAAGELLGVFTGYTEGVGDGIAPGSTASFDVDVYRGDCPIWAVAATGRT